MTTAGELRSGKGHSDENFPVASWLIDARYRGIILAFYEFVRVADDIADHASLKPDDKLAQLDRLEQNLLGNGDDNREAVRLRNALAERGLPPRHAQDLLTAFRMDVTKLRYTDWDDLIHYCSYSAMPVGRFVLDVHGESRATWAANDALCAALQINNHLQDCGKDFRDTYARQIVALLQTRDPLSQRVHLSKAQFALYGLGAVLINSLRRIGRARPAPRDAQRNA
jgi:squalene synthase HpnC